MLIAVPSENPGGLEAAISEHFGHCDAFTLVAVEDGTIGEVRVLANSAHGEGGCMAPVMLLKEHGVDVLVAGGMGGRPLAGFQQVGIAVHFKEDATSVQRAVDLFLSGGCRAFGEAETCGGGGCGGHHHHEAVERAPIVGPADIRDGRVVTFDYRLTTGDGELVDTSSSTGPMRYLHGQGHLLPALEAGLAGLEPGSSVVIDIPCADAFGERDPSRVLEVARRQLPPEVSVGDHVTAEDGHGNRSSLKVIHLDDAIGRLDANHALAGLDLRFDITVRAVESATPEELAHGHVH